MLTDIFEDVRKRMLQAFPERELYLRSGGEVSYYVFSTRLQVFLFSVLSLTALWCMITLLTLLWGQNPFGKPAQQIQRIEARYEQLLEDSRAKEENARLMLAKQHEDFSKVAKTFEEKHATISHLLKSQGQSPDALPITAGDYAKGRILVAPLTRDVVPRQSRTNYIQKSSLEGSDRIDSPLKNIADSQDTILMAAEIDTLRRIETSRALVTATGLSAERILKADNLGKGGPLIDAGSTKSPKDAGDFGSRIDGIKARLSEAEALETALTAMPLGHPIDVEHYKTSHYGMRKDPFTHRPTFHGGVDFASYRMAPIVAAADGKVSYAGWRGGYGRVVEIDHGYGFKTRYAHLAKTSVKRGQSVKAGDKIGGMGSSGRSTSTHLHYEIYFQDQDVNPEKFLKAAQYVR